MAAGSNKPAIPDEMSPEEARRYLICFLGRQALDEREEIYLQENQANHFYNILLAVNGSNDQRVGKNASVSLFFP